MSPDQPNSTVVSGTGGVSSNSVLRKLRWWLEVARVRLRFFLIVAFAGVVASQWPVLRSAWERWTWAGHRLASGAVSSSHEYFCPMDAGVISVWPAICPICNMDLVPRKKMEAQMLPDGVITRMQLSPYRIQLAGIRTSSIEPRTLKSEQTFTGVLQQLEDGALGFHTRIAESDVPLFSGANSAEVQRHSTSESASANMFLEAVNDHHRVRFVIDSPADFSPGDIVKAFVSLFVSGNDPVLAVPESAVLDRGRERMVYRETMPGLFDGVAVELGRRCGGYYPVTSGLKAGQRVATTGAFLIDAETRLNPSLAAGYFGASPNESNAKPSEPTEAAIPITKKTTLQPPLSREDKILVDKQRICPVTELALDSMGGPIPVIVSGMKVFVCCAGCTQRLKDEPEKYLLRLETR